MYLSIHEVSNVRVALVISLDFLIGDARWPHTTLALF